MPSAENREGDITFRGRCSFAGIVDLPADTVGDPEANANDPFGVDKCVHLHRSVVNQNGNMIDDTRAIHVARAPGTVRSIFAGSIAVLTVTATCTIDLKKNGVSILSAVITLDAASVARTMYLGTIADADYVAGDFFELIINFTVAGGAAGTGLIVQTDFAENLI